MDKYGYIKTFRKNGTELIYIVNNTRYTLYSAITPTNGTQYLSISEDRSIINLKLLGYKKILDNGLEEYIKDLIKNVCIPTISTLHITEYKFPPQPYFDALITKINNDWIENENLQNNTVLK